MTSIGLAEFINISLNYLEKQRLPQLENLLDTHPSQLFEFWKKIALTWLSGRLVEEKRLLLKYTFNYLKPECKSCPERLNLTAVGTIFPECGELDPLLTDYPSHIEKIKVYLKTHHSLYYLYYYLTAKAPEELLIDMVHEDPSSFVELSVSSERMMTLLFQKRPSEEHIALLHAKNAIGQSPLHIAAYLGNAKAVALLCEQRSEEERAALFSADFRGQTPLHLAVLHDKPALINALFAHVPIDQRTTLCRGNQRGETALYLASLRGHVNTVEALWNNSSIEEQTALCRQSKSGRTALHAAAAHGESSVIQLLFDLAGVEQRQLLLKADVRGETPLHLSMTFNHFHATFTLLCNTHEKPSERLSLFAHNMDGATPFNMAVKYKRVFLGKSVVDFLIAEESIPLAIQAAIADFYLHEALESEIDNPKKFLAEAQLPFHA